MGRGGGFPTDRLLTNENLIEEFLCPICVQLVEAPVITACSHVFCRPCMEEWMAQPSASKKCPKCNRVFSGVGSAADNSPPYTDLRAGNPLGFRILSRVQVRCALAGCSWKGDYSELSAHLTASDSHHTRGGGGGQTTKDDAEAMKLQGNARFEARSFQEAIKLYSKAITLDSTQPSFYANRAAAWLMVGAPNEALKDCDAALRIDPKHVRSILRLAKALLDMGKLPEALEHLRAAAERVPEAYELAQEFARVDSLCSAFFQAVAAYEGEAKNMDEENFSFLPEPLSKVPKVAKAAKVERDYELALQLFQDIENSASSVVMQLWVAKAAVMCAQCDKAITLTLRILKKDDKNSEALWVRGRALFFSGDIDQGVKHLRECLRQEPDMNKAAADLKMMRSVQELMSMAADSNLKRRFEEQVETITDVLAKTFYPPRVPILATLYASRANAHLRLQNFEATLKDCQAALAVRDDCKDAWIARASALMALGREQDARNELAHLLQGMYQQDTLIRHWHDKADMLARKKVRPDYYAILRVSYIATEAEIKNAYRARALECHPDKLAQMGACPEDIKTAENAFKMLGEALEVLGDPTMRGLYDEGYDKQAIDERVEAARRAARGDNRGHGHGHHHGHHHH